MSIASKINSSAVRDKAKRMLDNRSSVTSSGFYYSDVAQLHRHVRYNVSYTGPWHSDIARPTSTIIRGEGSTKSHVVLLTSLLETVGAEVRVVRCRSNEGKVHFLPEVYLADSAGSETQKIADALRDFYRKIGKNYNIFSFDAVDSKIWYPADSVKGTHVGDTRQLKRLGYIQENYSSWSWYDAEYIYSTSMGELTYADTHGGRVSLDQLKRDSAGRTDLKQKLSRMERQGVKMQSNCPNPKCNETIARDVSKSIATNVISSLMLEAICPMCGTVEIMIGDWELFSPF